MAAFTRKSTLTTLLFAIILDSGLAQGQAAAETRDAQEVQRLRDILRRYYKEETAQETDPAAKLEKSAEVVGVSGETYTPEQVLLNGAQGLLAVQTISQRLANAALPAQRRPSDIIFHAEVRRDGTLLTSKSHSLKPLGKSQYAAKISLQAGDVELTVREQEWSVSLPTTDSTDYVITLSALDDQQQELHVIPVAKLQATNASDMPAWLAQIGVVPKATPGA